MRVADNMIFDQVIGQVGKNRSEMVELQDQAATQKRVTKPSDDPVAASRVLLSKADEKGIEQFNDNLKYAQTFLDFTDQSLDEMTQYLQRVKELVLSQVNDASTSKTARRMVATEVSQLYDQMVQISNRKIADRHIFAGFKTKSPPFEYSGNYKGDDGELLVSIGKQSYMSMNIPGNRIFLGEGMSSEGIAVSRATQPRTIEELAQRMERRDKVRDQRGPNGEPPQNTILNPRSESTSIRGPASVNVKRAPQAGEIVYTPEKGIDLFNLVKNVEIALKTDDKAAMQSYLVPLDEAMDQVVLARSEVGARGMVLANAMDSLAQLKVENAKNISNLEDADAFQVVSDISKKQSALKATLMTSGPIMKESLLDFLR